jgi:hypothetical protein
MCIGEGNEFSKNVGATSKLQAPEANCKLTPNKHYVPRYNMYSPRRPLASDLCTSGSELYLHLPLSPHYLAFNYRSNYVFKGVWLGYTAISFSGVSETAYGLGFQVETVLSPLQMETRKRNFNRWLNTNFLKWSLHSNHPSLPPFIPFPPQNINAQYPRR